MTSKHYTGYSGPTRGRTQWPAKPACSSIAAFAMGLGFVFASTAGFAEVRQAPVTQGGELSVDKTTLTLKLKDGRVLSGKELQGATVHMALEGGRVASVLLNSIEPDPEISDVLRYDFQLADRQDRGASACAPNAYGERWGFPLALPVGHPGREGAVTLTCVSGAVGKCVRFGYKPWAKGPDGEDLLPYHAACVHMVRADYGGDGQPHTKDGTIIDIYDRLGIQKPETREDPAFSFEAAWAPGGAVCVRHTRWQDLLTLEQLRQQYPHLASGRDCSETGSQAQGALLFNRSKWRQTPAAD